MKKQEALKRLDSLENEAKELRKIIDTTQDEWMSLWADFCKENKINSADILPFPSPKNSKQEALNAEAMLWEIVEKANNDNSFPDWSNGTQRKWFPWFDMAVASGFGFSVTDCDDWYSLTIVGSRLAYNDRDLCIRTVKKYLPIYEKNYKK